MIGTTRPAGDAGSSAGRARVVDHGQRDPPVSALALAAA